MASCVLLLFIILPALCYANEVYKKEGFLDKLSTGMKFAQDFLGSESVALKVADFVVRAFNTVNNPNSSRRKQPQPMKDEFEEDFNSEERFHQEKQQNSNLHQTSSSMSPWRHLIRLLGLQPNQLSAVAVNALVFVAQMVNKNGTERDDFWQRILPNLYLHLLVNEAIMHISTFLTGSRRPERLHQAEDTTNWILNKNSRKLQDLITAAKNESLPELVEDIIKGQQSEEETSCIRLLVCKITPFINKMQDTVFGKDDQTNNNNNHPVDSRGVAILYRNLPTTEEIYNRSDMCEKLYKECDLSE